ncbi:MAG: hypothetical protein ACLRFE_00270 [Clostridia bacterium]
MKTPRIIERMTQRREEKKLNKPRYKIENLYCGEIVYVTDCKFVKGPTFWQCGHNRTYKHIKPFAIFYHNIYIGAHDFEDNYRHVITNHPLRQLQYAQIGEYAVNHDTLKDFDKYMQRYMISNNLKKNSRLSINDIKELENYVNQKLYPEQEKDKLFY